MITTSFPSTTIRVSGQVIPIFKVFGPFLSFAIKTLNNKRVAEKCQYLPFPGHAHPIKSFHRSQFARNPPKPAKTTKTIPKEINRDYAWADEEFLETLQIFNNTMEDGSYSRKFLASSFPLLFFLKILDVQYALY